MNKSILFSIVIPTYNRATLLKRCLESVEAQTYSNWEAIVVDNFSEDNTEEIIKSFGDKRIRYIKNHNYGVIAVSRNKALDMAMGDWICFLDSDDCWYPRKLERMLDFTDEYDLIYHGCRRNIPRSHIFQKLNLFFYEVKRPYIPYVILRGDPINPSCSCVSKKTIGTTRFSEERELIACEDYDFFLKLLEKDPRVKYLKEILTLYDVGGCSHVEQASERDKEIYKRWSKYLNEDEIQELKFQNIQRRADHYRSVSSFGEAKKLYKELFKSTLRRKKYIALRGLVLCYLKLSLS